MKKVIGVGIGLMALLLISCVPWSKIRVPKEYFSEIKWTLKSDKVNLEINLLEVESRESHSILKIDDKEYETYSEIGTHHSENLLWVAVFMPVNDEINEFGLKESLVMFEVSWEYDKGLENITYNMGKIFQEFFDFKIDLTNEDLRDIELSYEKIDISDSKFEPYDFRKGYFENENIQIFNPVYYDKMSYGHIIIDGKKERIKIAYSENSKFKIHKIVNGIIDTTTSISGTYSFTYPKLKFEIENNDLTEEVLDDITVSKSVFKGDNYQLSDEYSSLYRLREFFTDFIKFYRA